LIYGRYLERERESARFALEKSQLETQLAGAQLDALKMQLHPHFLFNTLNSISVLMREGDAEAANKMLVRLSELLRVALKSKEAQEVSLKDELEFLRGYLEIEQIRFQDRLKVDFKIEKETLDAQVPNLILQPLVENAVRHAVAPRAGATRIEIRAERENGFLRMIIRDDGDGFVKAENSSGSGIGLANTQKRLEKLYGANHDFRLVSEGGGFAATISIPFRRSENFAE
jgi:two-component system, LytTR family, sensor kinase